MTVLIMVVKGVVVVGGGGVSEGGGGAVGFVDYNQTPQNELNTLTYVLEI